MYEDRRSNGPGLLGRRGDELLLTLPRRLSINGSDAQVYFTLAGYLRQELGGGGMRSVVVRSSIQLVDGRKRQAHRAN